MPYRLAAQQLWMETVNTHNHCTKNQLKSGRKTTLGTSVEEANGYYSGFIQ